MSQGYITLALGAQRYYDMAINLAMSVRIKDPARPISLICDEDGQNKVPSELFDQIITLPDLDGYRGCANKLRIYDYTPYDETIFIDSDCIVMKQDMNRHWEKFSNHNFNIAGRKLFDGDYYGIDVANLRHDMNMDFIAVGNSGVIFFRKSDEAEKLFNLSMKLFDDQSILKISHGKTQGQIADEPIFGTAMGIMNIEPVEYTPDEGAVMIATWRGRRIRGNFDQDIAYLEKPLGGFHVLNRFFPKQGWVAHSPSIHHFIGLKPKKLYQDITDAVKKRYSQM